MKLKALNCLSYPTKIIYVAILFLFIIKVIYKLLINGKGTHSFKHVFVYFYKLMCLVCILYLEWILFTQHIIKRNSFTSACPAWDFVLLHSYFHEGRLFNESIIRIQLIFLFQNFGLWHLFFHGGRLFYALELWSIACESFPSALFGLYLKLISYVYGVFWGLLPLKKWYILGWHRYKSQEASLVGSLFLHSEYFLRPLKSKTMFRFLVFS